MQNINTNKNSSDVILENDIISRSKKTASLENDLQTAYSILKTGSNETGDIL